MSHKPLESCAALFADAGNPWATRDDWIREEKLAANPRANSRDRERAILFTRRHSVTPQRAKPRLELAPEIRPEIGRENSMSEILDRRKLARRMREIMSHD